MQPDLLQQLRDIHLPADPGWWPPAPGWWLLAVVLVCLLVWSLIRVRRAIRSRRPIRLARAYYDEVYAAYRQGQIDAPAYLHQTNELLKRLYVHALHDDAARAANDETWLRYLDQRSGGTAFSDGAGTQLGNQRFSPQAQADPEALHPLVAELFRTARP